MEDVQFLFDNQLIAEVEKLIRESKNRLILISPYIDLDRRIQDALREKIDKHNFELLVLFGKNEDNYYRSIKKDSLDFLKQFPNVEIRYNDRLHAKFYQNDFNYIMTSLNLYDYSLANNIEVGVKGTFAWKGLIGKVLNSTDSILNQGIDSVKSDVLGIGNDVNPIDKFHRIFYDSELKYKTEPIVEGKEGWGGLLGGKQLGGFNVAVNNFKDIQSASKTNDTKTPTPTNTEVKISYSANDRNNAIPKKTLSASQLSKAIGSSVLEITELMQKSGLIADNRITDLGLTKGLVMKNYMGKDYIAYPENLPELELLSNRRPNVS